MNASPEDPLTEDPDQDPTRGPDRIPDFVPDSMQDEHVEQARDQVEHDRWRREHLPQETGADEPAVLVAVQQARSRAPDRSATRAWVRRHADRLPRSPATPATVMVALSLLAVALPRLLPWWLLLAAAAGTGMWLLHRRGHTLGDAKAKSQAVTPRVLTARLAARARAVGPAMQQAADRARAAALGLRRRTSEEGFDQQDAAQQDAAPQEAAPQEAAPSLRDAWPDVAGGRDAEPSLAPVAEPEPDRKPGIVGGSLSKLPARGVRRRQPAAGDGGFRQHAWAHRLSSADLFGTTVAVVLGLLGLVGLTSFWGWLAVTNDPFWWVYTVLGAAVSVPLGWLVWVLASVWSARDLPAQPADRGQRHEPALRHAQRRGPTARADAGTDRDAPGNAA